MSETKPVKRAKHLMDPNNPRPSVRKDAMHVSHVQKWVMSVLAVTTILHLVVGLVLAAAMVEDDRLDAQIGLLVIAGIFGVLSVAVGRVIHQRSMLTPWLLLGPVPALIGAWFVL
ncbi:MULTISPECIES: hypothetical protein [unclassified Nocardioides]|uniref:hypothetical protein n=1 Tax=unclassified Nocardioides TaxID=2615069 RepID=UPI0006FEECA6|nr:MULTISPECIES: hypothetical protein [unclassified Nocardioides]KQY55502.1 hypothetical protein ASD30_16515 [Nocardioides sp. Root140]KQZ67165.1 hypothetical protein ASD66_19455 [Nocardioides sp. Root151]KRF12761.1 hypothetical protein ASH02_14610 [Nocardioides sp. Soil796]